MGGVVPSEVPNRRLPELPCGPQRVGARRIGRRLPCTLQDSRLDDKLGRERVTWLVSWNSITGSRYRMVEEKRREGGVGGPLLHGRVSAGGEALAAVS